MTIFGAKKKRTLTHAELLRDQHVGMHPTFVSRPPIGSTVEFRGEGGALFGKVLRYEDGYAMVQWSGGRVVTGVTSSKLRVVPSAWGAKRHGPERPSVAEVLDRRQKKAEQGNWYPASGGKEEPFRTRTGRTLLYVWQPSTGHHAYLDVGTDMLLSTEEAEYALGHRR